MNIRVKCTNKALPNYGEVRDFSTVKDHLMYDKAGFDVLREDKDLPLCVRRMVQCGLAGQKCGRDIGRDR